MHFPTWVDLKGQDAVPETVHHVVCYVNPNSDTSWHSLPRKVKVRKRKGGVQGEGGREKGGSTGEREREGWGEGGVQEREGEREKGWGEYREREGEMYLIR